MGYIVKKGNIKKGQKPFLIVNQKSGEIVGTSEDLEKANRSIGYRTGEAKPKTRA